MPIEFDIVVPGETTRDLDLNDIGYSCGVQFHMLSTTSVPKPCAVPPEYTYIGSTKYLAGVFAPPEGLRRKMNKIVIPAFCWTAFCFMVAPVFGKPALNKDVVLVVNRVRQAPRIDGKLDDFAWKSASKIELRWTETGAQIPDRFRTQVSVVYDDNGLYVAFMNKDPAISNLRSANTEHDRCLTGDDTIGIFLEPDATGEGHSFRVTVNAGNTVRDVWRPSEANLDMKREGEIPSELIPIAMAYTDARDWEPKGVETAVGLVDSSWTVEISIPFGDLLESRPKRGTWGVNFMRRIVGQYSSFVTWTNGGRGFIRPDRYGRLVFSD